MKKEQVVFYKKENNKWIECHYIDETNIVHEYLLHDLIAKKLHKCTYIKSISDDSNYDGTRDITVLYDGNVKRVYTVIF